MTDAPDLSILMVNWNTRDMTLACLRSVFAETGDTSFELILVDNGSADGSAEAIAAEFPQVKVIAESENHGFAKANNIAAKLATGQFLLLLNTDSVVLDGAIDKSIAFARANPSAKLWGARTLWEDGTLNPTSVWKRVTPWSAFSFAVGLRGALSRFELFNPEGMGHWPRDTVREVDIVAGCFLLMERSFWNALGGFDARFFMYGEEADLCARARAAGAKPLMTPDATIIHYGGKSAASHASKIVYVMGARIGLVQSQSGPIGGAIGRLAFIAHVGIRAYAFGLLSRLRPARFEKNAREWGHAWSRRAEWRGGPSAVEVKR